MTILLELSLTQALESTVSRALAAQERALALRERELDLYEISMGIQSRLIIESVTLETADGRVTIMGEITMQELREGQQFTATARPKSKRGSATKVQEGSVEWATSDPAVCTVAESPDNELSALIVAQGPGEAVVSLKADADRGDGVKEIIGVITVVVNPGDATVFDLEAGPIEETPEPVAGGGGEGTTPGETPTTPVEPVTPVETMPAPEVQPGTSGETGETVPVDERPQPFNG